MYSLLSPALYTLDPERAHRLSIWALKMLQRSGLGAAHHRENGPMASSDAHAAPQSPPQPTPQPPLHTSPLSTNIAGVAFPNPVGLAAGFDKDGEVADGVLALGFGFTEIGSITPLAQDGNPRPRLFRLTQDKAVINRMGFNNKGAEAARERLEKRLQARAKKSDGGKANKRGGVLGGRMMGGGVLGINIGANKLSEDKAADYAAMTRIMAPYADYLTVNISSPNTPGLRALQDEGALIALLDQVIAARQEICAADTNPPPIFLKLAPDLTPKDIDAITRIAIDKALGALIISNTTIARPAHMQSPLVREAGGLSGAPLKALALQRLRDFSSASGGALPLIGVGGIGSAEDAWERIKAGASLIQLYSALVYQGPGLARRIVKGLERLMQREGFTHIDQAVGSEK